MLAGLDARRGTTVKSELRRIATALQHLDDLNTPAAPVARPLPPRGDRLFPSSSKSTATPARQPAPAELPPLPNGPAPVNPALSQPQRKPLRFSRHHHSINPALVTSLLAELQTTTQRWQEELKQVLQDIQNVYLEGPIVEGWLESHPQSTDPQLVASIAQQYDSEFASRAGYRLCGFDEDGRVWSKYCPPDQVPGVSMAIARYQKLRQRLERKQAIEQRLHDLAETLIQTRSRFNDTQP